MISLIYSSETALPYDTSTRNYSSPSIIGSKYFSPSSQAASLFLINLRSSD
jgi:hypothetical protein